MLIEFRVENHRSIRDEQALTMEASLPDTDADLRPRETKSNDKKLLPVAAIYGANASGKTNVLRALSFMRRAVVTSQRLWIPNEGVPRFPFAWDGGSTGSSEYVVKFIVDDVRYEYGFIASDSEFLEEWLFAWPKGHKQEWFVRDQDQYKFSASLVGPHSVIQKITRPNSLFLSAAIQNGYVQLLAISNWFAELRTMNLTGESSFAPIETFQFFDGMGVPNLFEEFNADETVKVFRSFLQNADIGIVDVQMRIEERSVNGRLHKSRRFRLKHQSSDPEAWLPLEEESGGTQTLFRMAMPILNVLRKGSVLLVDEIESSLHPMVAAQIILLFNNRDTNPRNAQLIFTTHDTNLLGTTLGEPLLRRDQVWFTEKDQSGSTRLYPLTDYMPRKNENLERGYLQGRYGAIPFLGDFKHAAEVP
jgi:hypothetical protein